MNYLETNNNNKDSLIVRLNSNLVIESESIPPRDIIIMNYDLQGVICSYEVLDVCGVSMGEFDILFQSIFPIIVLPKLIISSWRENDVQSNGYNLNTYGDNVGLFGVNLHQ